MAARRKAVAPRKGFKTGVHVSATLERSGDAKSNDYNYDLRKLFVDCDGHLVANADCDDVFVCTKNEIPEILAFLQQIVEAQ